MTNEERLRELGDDDQSYLLTPERAACLAGAEALRLLREYQRAHADRVPSRYSRADWTVVPPASA